MSVAKISESVKARGQGEGPAHQGHDHHHHSHEHHHKATPRAKLDTLVIRPMSGLSGDMCVAGFARMADATNAELSAVAAGLGLPGNAVVLEQKIVSTVSGWHARIALPHEHSHRTLKDVCKIIADSDMSPRAKAFAEDTFSLLAVAEGKIHGIAPEKVTFHEVGALDSILDTCISCAMYDRMDAPRLVCGALPLCDGMVRCAHGLMPTPAPAVLDLLEGVPVRGIASRGETVTPTAISLLKGLGAEFGEWPEMTINERALVYGTRTLPGVANGAIFARGPGRHLAG